MGPPPDHGWLSARAQQEQNRQQHRSDGHTKNGDAFQPHACRLDDRCLVRHERYACRLAGHGVRCHHRIVIRRHLMVGGGWPSRVASAAWLLAFSVWLTFAAAACGSGTNGDGEASHGSSAGLSGGAASTGMATAGGGAGLPAEPIAVGATNAQLTRPFSVSAIGAGENLVGEVNIQDNVGTITIGGTKLAAVVYEQQPFEDYYLYQTLAVASDRLYVVWLYCLNDQLGGVYVEGTDGTPLSKESANGACAVSATETTSSVQLPALTMNYPTPLSGYTIEGADLELASGGPGVAHIHGTTYAVAAFEQVDCRLCDDFGGWYEVHALLWDGEHLCFTIFYLRDDEPILATYALCLSDLSDPVGSTLLDATFTH